MRGWVDCRMGEWEGGETERREEGRTEGWEDRRQEDWEGRMGKQKDGKSEGRGTDASRVCLTRRVMTSGQPGCLLAV